MTTIQRPIIRPAIPQRKAPARFAANIPLCILLLSAYYFFAWIYSSKLQDSVLGLAIRLPDLDYGAYNSNLIAGSLYAITPLIWMRNSDAPSKSFYVYLLFAVFVPSILFTIMNDMLDLNGRHIKCAVLVICMFIIYSQVFFPRLLVLNRVLSKKIILWLLLIIGGVAPLLLLAQNPSALLNVQFLDVYEQRLELRDAISSGQASRMKVYLTNWLGVAVAPFLTAMGIYLKKKWMIAAALFIALIAFSISTHKAVFFSSIIVLVFAICLSISRRFGIKPETRYLGFGYTILFGLLLPATLLDALMGNGILGSFLITFRMFVNNGYLTSVYFEYFSTQDMLLYADSFLRGIVPNPHDQSYARRVGDYIAIYLARNNANANFLADGYVNLGYVGMMISAFQAAVVFYIADSISHNKNKAIAVCVFLPSVFIFTNAPIHTALSSNGAMVALLLLRLVPEETGKKGKI